jgi:hypothetical protein
MIDVQKLRQSAAALFQKRNWLWLTAVPVVLGTLTGVVGNVGKVSGWVADTMPWVADHVMATRIALDSQRRALGTSLLGRTFPKGAACFSDAQAVDLDGDGVTSDLAVFFHRADGKGVCNDDSSPIDAAFFRRDGFGDAFAGSMPLPPDIDVWRVVGPVVFREIANGSSPEIDAYMFYDGKMHLVGNIDSTSAGDYEGTNYLPQADNQGALAFNQAGMWRVRFDKIRKAVVEPVTAGAILAQNDNGHLLEFGFEGLKFDGQTLAIKKYLNASDAVDAPVNDANRQVEPSDGETYAIRIWPGDHLFLVGCTADGGLTPDAKVEGAFQPDFSAHPSARCALGEDTRFHVRIEPQQAQ